MPRATRLRPIRSACYYYRRSSARQIFCDREGLEALIEALTRVLRRSGAALYAFHLDPTQLHFVARAGSAPLVSAFGVLCHELARQANRSRGGTGSLFVQRARITLFQPDTWLLPIVRYVHAVQAPKGSPSAGSADPYRYHRRVAGLDTTAVFQALASRAGRSALLDDEYAEYFDAPTPPGERYLIEHGSPEDNRILGDQDFIASVREVGAIEHNNDLQTSESSEEEIRRAAERVIGQFHALCRQYLSGTNARKWITRTTLPLLRSKSRKLPLPLVRALIADDVLARGVATRSEVELFFQLHPKSLCAGLRRRYHVRLTTRFGSSLPVATHGGTPDLGRGTRRMNAELPEDAVAIGLDR